MGCDICDNSKDYWPTNEQLAHVLMVNFFTFLYFFSFQTMTMILAVRTQNTVKTTTYIQLENDAYSKYYALSEHLAIGTAVVLFKRRVIFKQYTPRNKSTL
jgi:hypothetical protein